MGATTTTSQVAGGAACCGASVDVAAGTIGVTGTTGKPIDGNAFLGVNINSNGTVVNLSTPSYSVVNSPGIQGPPNMDVTLTGDQIAQAYMNGLNHLGQLGYEAGTNFAQAIDGIVQEASSAGTRLSNFFSTIFNGSDNSDSPDSLDNSYDDSPVDMGSIDVSDVGPGPTDSEISENNRAIGDSGL